MCDCVPGADTQRADDEVETADGGDGEGAGPAAQADAGEGPVRNTGGLSQRGAAGDQQTVCMCVCERETTKGKMAAHTSTDPNGADLIPLLTFSRHTILQKEKEQQREQHEQTVQKLLAKHEKDMSHLHQEHALSAAKVHTPPPPQTAAD